MPQHRKLCTTKISLLTASLSVYISAIENGDFDLAALVSEAGVRCPRCRSRACAGIHGTWYRKKVTDLSTGDVFQQVPILRVIFCDGSSASLMHAELWRGRHTVSSVLETTSHVLEDGLGKALEWTMYAGRGEAMVSERALRRWTKRVLSRLDLLEDLLGIITSPAAGTPSKKLIRVLDRIQPVDLLRFRSLIGYAMLDKPPLPPQPAQTSARPKPGHHSPAPPHDPPSHYLPRGTRYEPHRPRFPSSG